MVLAGVEFVEDQRGMGVRHGLAGVVGQKVLFGDIGDVAGLIVFRQQVIERLVLARADFLGNLQPVFIGVGEHRIDIEDHAAEREHPMPDDLADAEFGESSVHD